MKIIFFTLGIIISLFSYSNEPLDSLNGKSLICAQYFVPLDMSLDPTNIKLQKDHAERYTGFKFFKNKVSIDRIKQTGPIDQDNPRYWIPKENHITSKTVKIYKITSRYVFWKAPLNTWQYKYYRINRENLYLDEIVVAMDDYYEKNDEINPILFENDGGKFAYCALSKNHKSYEKYMKNLQIKDKENIDRANKERDKRKLEQLKKNKI